MAKIRNVIIVYFVIFMFSLINSVNGDCIVEFQDKVPILIKKFGSREFLVKTGPSIELSENESIGAYCENNIVVHQRNYGNDQMYSNNINIGCKNSYLDVEGRKYNSVSVYCNEVTSIFYESRQPLPNCPQNMTYGIGYPMTNPLKSHITAAICYDLERLELKFVNYLAQDSTLLTREFAPVTLDQPIVNSNNYFLFPSKEHFQASLEMNKIKEPILKPYEFDLESIIQDREIDGTIQTTHNFLFNIIWWRNLRLGNWMEFLNTLEERKANVSYSIYMGTSDVIELPLTPNKCKATVMLNFDVGTKNRLNTPKYIWSYLKSLDANVQEEFIVIGVNSPFYQESNDIFCEDVCDNISWLRNSRFGYWRQIITRGVMFCCRPEDVMHKFQPFPIESKTITTTEPDTGSLPYD